MWQPPTLNLEHSEIVFQCFSVWIAHFERERCAKSEFGKFFSLYSGWHEKTRIWRRFTTWPEFCSIREEIRRKTIPHYKSIFKIWESRLRYFHIYISVRVIIFWHNCIRFIMCCDFHAKFVVVMSTGIPIFFIDLTLYLPEVLISWSNICVDFVSVVISLIAFFFNGLLLFYRPSFLVYIVFMCNFV